MRAFVGQCPWSRVPVYTDYSLIAIRRLWYYIAAPFRCMRNSILAPDRMSSPFAGRLNRDGTFSQARRIIPNPSANSRRSDAITCFESAREPCSCYCLDNCSSCACCDRGFRLAGAQNEPRRNKAIEHFEINDPQKQRRLIARFYRGDCACSVSLTISTRRFSGANRSTLFFGRRFP